jgi:hypothetical protein
MHTADQHPRPLRERVGGSASQDCSSNVTTNVLLGMTTSSKPQPIYVPSSDSDNNYNNNNNDNDDHPGLGKSVKQYVMF